MSMVNRELMSGAEVSECPGMTLRLGRNAVRKVALAHYARRCGYNRPM